MGFLKQIWKSNNPGTIREYIESSHGGGESEQRELSGIAQHCQFPELRVAAAEKLKMLKYENLMSIAVTEAKKQGIQPVNSSVTSTNYNNNIISMFKIMEARAKGDIATIQDLLDSISGSNNARSELFGAAAATDDLELLAMLAMSIKTLGEWNGRENVLEPLLNMPGYEEVAAHYNELTENEIKRKEQELQERNEEWSYIVQRFPEMKLNREWFDEEWSDYPLAFETKVAIYHRNQLSAKYFFDTLYNSSSSTDMYERLNGFINLHGNTYYDRNGFPFRYSFANEYEEDDCFADSGILFQFEVGNSVLLTNKEFYDVVEDRCLAWCEDHHASEKKMELLLSRLKDSLENNHPFKQKAKGSKPVQTYNRQTKDKLIQCSDKEYSFYYYRKNSDGTVTVAEYSASRPNGQIAAVLDGHPVSEISGVTMFSPVTNLFIPEGIRTIGLQSFKGCSISETLTLPAGISIQSHAFRYSNLPKTVIIPESAMLDGDCFSYSDQTKTLFVGPHAALKGNAFSYSEDLQTVICAPGSTITDKALSYCYRLEKVVLCGNVELGKETFQDVDGLKIINEGEEKYTQALEEALKKIRKTKPVGKDNTALKKSRADLQQKKTKKGEKTWITPVFLLLFIGIIAYFALHMGNKTSGSGSSAKSVSFQVQESMPSSIPVLCSVGDTAEFDGLKVKVTGYTFSPYAGGFSDRFPKDIVVDNLVVYIDINNFGEMRELANDSLTGEGDYHFEIIYDNKDKYCTSYERSVLLVDDEFLLANRYITPNESMAGKVLNFKVPLSMQNNSESIILTMSCNKPDKEETISWILR